MMKISNQKVFSPLKFKKTPIKPSAEMEGWMLENKVTIKRGEVMGRRLIKYHGDHRRCEILTDFIYERYRKLIK